MISFRSLAVSLCPIIALIWANGVVLAAPDISNVDGVLSHRGNVIISGTGFGTKAPAAPLWWDDGEGAVTNSPSIMMAGEMTWVTSSTINGSSKHYNDVWPKNTTDSNTRMQYRSVGRRGVPAPHSRSTKYLTGCHDDEGECLGGEVGQNVGLTLGDFNRHSTWYVSYYLRLDPLWPADGSSHNYKFFNWEMGTPRSVQYSSPFCYDNTNGCTGPVRATPGCNYDYWSGATAVFIIDMTTCTNGWTSPNFGAPFITHNTLKHNPLKQWVKQEHILDYDTSKYWFGVDNVEFWDTANKPGCRFNTSACPSRPSAVTIGGFWKEDVCGNNQDKLNDNACRYFDDVYIDNTFSRIVLTDNADYESATIVEPQIPSAWNNTSITVTVNLGRLPDTGTAYLFVFDANNTHNQVGLPVTIGGGGTFGSGGIDTVPPGMPFLR